MREKQVNRADMKGVRAVERGRAFSTLRRCAGGFAGGSRDHRGSAIVLVLVTIVLMAILAATMLQVARFERIPRPNPSIDIVVESVVAEIANQLTDDLLDADGNMFNARMTQSSGNPYQNSNKGGDEPWDFPYTNYGPTGTPTPGFFGREAVSIDGTTVAVYGGGFDDSWLAATAPEFRTGAQIPANSVTKPPWLPIPQIDPNYGMWPKITNLTGMYLRGVGNAADETTGATLSTRKEPIEDFVNSAFIPNLRDMNIPITSLKNPNNVLVDADGDGIGDSRWEWAPIRQIGTTRYVMAVRVVDLSARVDANVAWGSSRPGDDVFALRGNSPVELDGEGFARRFAAEATVPGANSVTAQNEWRQVVNHRLGNPVTPAYPGTRPEYDGNAPTPTVYSRRHFFENAAALISPRFERNPAPASPYSNDDFFKAVDAFELLDRNGFNSNTTTTFEERMPLTTRDANPNDDDTTFATAIAGTPRAGGQNWSPVEFWEKDFRKHITMFSGSMNVARPLAFNKQRLPKLDVNVLLQASFGQSLIRTRILNEVLTAAKFNTLNDTSRRPHLTSASGYADQMVANWTDYSDEDNWVTIFQNRAGFEALPFISEAYTQRVYTVTNNPQAATDPATGSPLAEWSADPADEVGYVIEIANPFAWYDGSQWRGRPIRLTDVWITIGGQQIKLEDETGVPDVLEPDEVVMIYRDSTGNITRNNLHNVQDRWSTTQDGRDVAAEIQGPEIAKTGRVVIQMFCAEDRAGGAPPSAPANWPYTGIDLELPDATLNEVGPPATLMQGHKTFVQSSFIGVGHGLRMMTVGKRVNDDATNGYRYNNAMETEPSLNSDDMSNGEARLDGPGVPKHQLTVADKANGVPNTKFRAYDTPERQQWVWLDSPRNRMEYIGDILQIPLIGFNNRFGFGRVTMDEALRAAGQENQALGIEALMLPYKATPENATQDEQAKPYQPAPFFATIGSDFGVWNFPTGLLLMEHFTTFNPAWDGKNGDGDSQIIESPFPNGEDDDELLVPGKINLNTASRQVLRNVLPFEDDYTRAALADLIIERRESLRQRTNYGLGIDNMPAVPYVSALFEQIEEAKAGEYPKSDPRFTGGSFPGNPSQDNGDTSELRNSRIDFTDHEPNVGAFPALADGIIDDREEEIMLSKWLQEMTDTRSDVFAAYIIVQGYPARDFTGGAVESARLMVIFSRANVKGAGDSAEEIARFRFK